MKFLFSLSLVAFTGILTCRANEVKGPVSFDKASKNFVEHFNSFNKSDSRAARLECHVSGITGPGQDTIGLEVTFWALENTFHWDKEKISFLGYCGPAAWEKMIEVHLGYWYMYFQAIHCNENIKPILPPTQLECDLFNAIQCLVMLGPDPDMALFLEAVREIEDLWSKLLLLEGGRMYEVQLSEYDVRVGNNRKNSKTLALPLPDILITRYVHFLAECHLHPGKIPGPGKSFDNFKAAKVSNYKFVKVDAQAAATTPWFKELQHSIHAPRSGLTQSFALFAGSAASSQKQKEWAALIARSSAAETPRHRTLIALAGLAIFAFVVMTFCLCSRKKKQDAARFDDLDAVVTVV